MKKSIIALAVAGIVSVPTVAAAADEEDAPPARKPMAGGTSIQIFGRIYTEYSYSSNRGQAGSASGAPVGELVSADLLQAPDSEIGIKGEESLGGGDPAYFVTTILSFATEEGARAAVASDAARALSADIANFTSVTPVMQFNTAVP